MKILYLVHQFYPRWYTGTEKFVLNLAAMMQVFGHKVKVAAYGFPGEMEYDKNVGGALFRSHLYKGIPVDTFSCRTEPSYPPPRREGRGLQRGGGDAHRK